MPGLWRRTTCCSDDSTDPSGDVETILQDPLGSKDITGGSHNAMFSPGVHRPVSGNQLSFCCPASWHLLLVRHVLRFGPGLLEV